MTGTVTVVQPLMANSSPTVWSSGVFDCFDDMGACCCALWCYPCFFSSTLSDFNESSCLLCCDVGVPSPIHLALRYGVRKQYGIQGTLCDDWLKVVCCNACSMCQVAREIKLRKMQQHTTTVINVQPVHVQMPNPGGQQPAFHDPNQRMY